MEPTVEQWQATFASVDSGDAVEGATSEEIADALGLCRDVARMRIREAIKANVLMYAGKKKVLRVDGVSTMVPVYRIVGGDDA